jgi:hypothetical protein
LLVEILLDVLADLSADGFFSGDFGNRLGPDRLGGLGRRLDDNWPRALGRLTLRGAAHELFDLVGHIGRGGTRRQRTLARRRNLPNLQQQLADQRHNNDHQDHHDPADDSDIHVRQ